MRVRPLVAALLAGAMALSACSGPEEDTLLWSDEFDDDGAPDPAVWVPETGLVRNEELQWYQSDNATVEDGVLTIEARRESRNGADYTSSSLTTKDRREFRYGRVEVRARVDARAGLWPAIWLLGSSIDEVGWPMCGEIDMLEYYQDSVYANVAYGPVTPTWDTARTPLPELGDDWAEEFHVWRMDWDEDSIELYLDDELVNEFDVEEATRPDGSNPFRDDMYLLLNLAVGGTNGGDPSDTGFPATFEVDYVRVHR